MIRCGDDCAIGDSVHVVERRRSSPRDRTRGQTPLTPREEPADPPGAVARKALRRDLNATTSLASEHDALVSDFVDKHSF